MVELFTSNYGRIRAFAKYAQSKKPRFGGLLNTFNYVDASLSQRSTTFGVHDMVLIQPFNSLTSNYKKLSLGFRMLEAIRATTQVNNENGALFDLTIHYLMKLDEAVSYDSFMTEWYFMMLECEGLISEPMNLSENEYRKMLESYTGVLLKGSL